MLDTVNYITCLLYAWEENLQCQSLHVSCTPQTPPASSRRRPCFSSPGLSPPAAGSGTSAPPPDSPPSLPGGALDPRRGPPGSETTHKRGEWFSYLISREIPRSIKIWYNDIISDCHLLKRMGCKFFCSGPMVRNFRCQDLIILKCLSCNI